LHKLADNNFSPYASLTFLAGYSRLQNCSWKWSPISQRAFLYGPIWYWTWKVWWSNIASNQRSDMLCGGELFFILSLFEEQCD